jgi:O-succinylbenzoate synthase
MRLDAVELSIVKLPLVRPFATSFGRMAQREFLLAAVSSDGVVGWGECVADADPYDSSETTASAWHVLTRYLVPAVLGRRIGDPRETHAAWHRVRGHSMAKAALEMAIWDLAARAAGKPLCEFIGGAPRPIPAGVSIGIEGSVPALVERVRIELAEGYRRVKIKIRPGWDREPVAAIRSQVGDVPLVVDADGAYRPEDLAALQALDVFDLMMIEQPLGYDDLVRHARLQTDLHTPICLDESITGPDRAADAIELQSCRAINIKPGRMGGIGPSIAVHDLAAQHGIPLGPGGMLESGIGRAHNLHLATLPGFTLPGDIAASRRYFAPDLIDPPIDVIPGGVVPVPGGIGIGVDPVPARLEAATIHLERFNA